MLGTTRYVWCGNWWDEKITSDEFTSTLQVHNKKKATMLLWWHWLSNEIKSKKCYNLITRVKLFLLKE